MSRKPNQDFEVCLITLNFDIGFGGNLPKTLSLVPSSLLEYQYPCKNFESGIFLALITQK